MNHQLKVADFYVHQESNTSLFIFFIFDATSLFHSSASTLVVGRKKTSIDKKS